MGFMQSERSDESSEERLLGVGVGVGEGEGEGEGSGLSSRVEL